MDLLQLKYFQTVAKYEHVSHAAADLHIAQPSLSQVINRLERELGVCLFERQGRRIKLNQFGRLFLRRVERMFLELEDGKRELLDLAGQECFKVSIALNIVSLLPKLMEGFVTINPQINIRQTMAATVEMQRLLENGMIDFCLASPPIRGGNIECIPLITEEFFLLVPQGHKLAARQSINLNEAAQEPFISLKEGYGIRDMTNQFCNQAGFTPNIVFEGDIATTLVDLVNIGLGVALLPVHMWSDFPEKVPVLLHVKEPVCSRAIGLSILQNHYLSPAAKRFKDYIIDYFGKLNIR